MIDILSAIQLASHCLFVMKEFQDCLTLLTPITSAAEATSSGVNGVTLEDMVNNSKRITSDSQTELNPIAGMYNIILIVK